MGSSSCTAVSGHEPSTCLIMYTYVEEVKLISLATDAVGEEEGISLQPRHRLGRILEADAGTAHDDSGDGWYLGGFSEHMMEKEEVVKFQSQSESEGKREREHNQLLLLWQRGNEDSLGRAPRDYLTPPPDAEVRWQLPLALRVWGSSNTRAVSTRHPRDLISWECDLAFDLIKFLQQNPHRTSIFIIPWRCPTYPSLSYQLHQKVP